MLHFGSLVGDEDLADGVGELDGDGLVFAEFAGVVVELGEGEDVAGDGFEISVAVLDVDDEGDGHVGAIVGAEAELEAGRQGSLKVYPVAGCSGRTRLAAHGFSLSFVRQQEDR